MSTILITIPPFELQLIFIFKFIGLLIDTLLLRTNQNAGPASTICALENLTLSNPAAKVHLMNISLNVSLLCKGRKRETRGKLKGNVNIPYT